jgi:hypothetical protein
MSPIRCEQLRDPGRTWQTLYREGLRLIAGGTLAPEVMSSLASSLLCGETNVLDGLLRQEKKEVRDEGRVRGEQEGPGAQL